MFFVFSFFIGCGPCPTGEILCDDQCVPESITAAELSENIFSKSCAFSSCHSSASSASAGLQLHDEESLLAMINRASEQEPEKMLIVSGDPQNSYLIHKMRGENLTAENDSMPPGSTLCESKIQLVEEWISNL
jgi:hypothetical protein